jgi:hypothetical protein
VVQQRHVTIGERDVFECCYRHALSLLIHETCMSRQDAKSAKKIKSRRNNHTIVGPVCSFPHAFLGALGVLAAHYLFLD